MRAPFHGGSGAEYVRAMGDLSNFVGMLAASTALLEAITQRAQEQTERPVALAGTSRGGFAANLHRACFDTADRYVPLLAGAEFGDLFVHSAYRHLVDDATLRRAPYFRDRLDFGMAFRDVSADDCSPLLARHDRVVEYDRQRPSYEGMTLTVLDRGHITGALAADALRTHIVDALAP